MEDEGISLLELFKRIWKEKIVLLITTLVIIIIGIIFAVFGIKGKGKYEVTFSYDFPGIENGNYADSTKFDYRDIITLDNLNSVKASDEKYKNVNTVKLAEKNAIRIALSKDESISGDTLYTLTISCDYFANNNLAKEFLQDLTITPISKSSTIIKSLETKRYLNLYNNGTDYNQDINLLLNQKDYLTSSYASLIEKYGDLTISNKKLSEYAYDINQYVNESVLRDLDTYINLNGLVKNYEKEKNHLELSKESLIAEAKLNHDKIDALTTKLTTILTAAGSISSDYAAYNDQIAALIVRNCDIDIQIEQIDDKLANSAEEALYDNTNSIFLSNYEMLEEYSEIFKANLETTYLSNNRVNYEIASTISYSSSTNKVLVIVAFLFVGVIMGMCVSLITYQVKNKKKKETIL